MAISINKVHKELAKACPVLVNGLDFKISKEGKIESNVSLDVLHTFLDKHCPDRKFIRTGKFKDNLAKVIEDQTEEVEVDEHQHFCEAMGLSYSKKFKKVKRVVIIPSVDVVTVELEPSVKSYPDVDAAVLIYIYMNGGLYSIQPSMFVHVRTDLKMLTLANSIRHFPTCIFQTIDGPKSYEDRRPIFHLLENKLVLQATDTPLNKIRKSDSGLSKEAGHAQNNETTASTIYVSHEGILYSMKPAQFSTLQNNTSTLATYKSLKHHPTCIYETTGILYSNDIKRPIYTIVGDKFIQTQELLTA